MVLGDVQTTRESDWLLVGLNVWMFSAHLHFVCCFLRICSWPLRESRGEMKERVWIRTIRSEMKTWQSLKRVIWAELLSPLWSRSGAVISSNSSCKWQKKWRRGNHTGPWERWMKSNGDRGWKTGRENSAIRIISSLTPVTLSIWNPKGPIYPSAVDLVMQLRGGQHCAHSPGSITQSIRMLADQRYLPVRFLSVPCLTETLTDWRLPEIQTTVDKQVISLTPAPFRIPVSWWPEFRDRPRQVNTFPPQHKHIWTKHK